MGKTQPIMLKGFYDAFSLKPNMKNSVNKKLCNFEILHNARALYLYQWFDYSFEDVKEIKYLSLQGPGTSYKNIFAYTDNREQNL